MDEISVDFQTNNKISFRNFKTLFCNLFNSFDKSEKCKFKFNQSIDSIISSGFISRNTLEFILENLDENSYYVNCDQTIYSFKTNGKAFFINKNNYDFNIYLHQTNVQFSRFNTINENLMYILMNLFSHNLQQYSDQDLKIILNILPENYYEYNCDKTIYSFKINGKPFFMDKNICNNSYESEDIPDSDEDAFTLSLFSLAIGIKFSDNFRSIFMKYKENEKLKKTRMIELLITNGYNIQEGNKYVSRNLLNPRIYLNRKKPIPQNGNYEDPKKLPLKPDDWDISLIKRRVHCKSDYMISLLDMKEIKRILKSRKKVLFEKNDRNGRKKVTETNAHLQPVVKCDICNQKLHTINESEE